MIPELDPDTGRLPYRPLLESPIVTVDDIADRYATNDHRTHLWRHFLLWLDNFNQLDNSGARLFLSGSYLTDRTQPNDVDVLAVFDVERLDAARPAARQRSMWTWDDVTAVVDTAGERRALGRLQPYGGLVDAHAARTIDDELSRWATGWTTEYDDDKQPTGVRMGCLEVAR